MFYFAKKIGPKVVYKNDCKVPVEYNRVAKKVKTPKTTKNVYVPPAPKSFSAKGISPVNCLILNL